MILRYLGTAAAEGWPALFCQCEACQRAARLGGKNLRTRAQAVVDGRLLLDFGPDTYLHMLHQGLDLPRVRTLLVTHAHQDHWYPQELMMRGEPFAHLRGAGPLSVYGCAEVGATYGEIAAREGGADMAQAVRFREAKAFTPFEADGYRVTPLTARHDSSRECLMYLVERDGKTIFYAHDSGLYPEETWEYLAGVRLDLVSFDCTNVLGTESGYHMGLPADIEARDRLARQGSCHAGTRYVLNHFSHNGELPHDEIERLGAAEGFLTAYDGFEVEI